MKNKPEVRFSQEVLNRLLGWMIHWPEISADARNRCEALFGMADPEPWKEDLDEEARCSAVAKASELRRALKDRHLIEARLREDMRRHAESGVLDSVLSDAKEAAADLDGAAVLELEEMVKRKIAWCSLHALRRPMRRMMECLESHDYDDLGKFLSGAKTVFQRGALAVRDVEDGGLDSNLDFTLGENSERVFREANRALRMNNNIVRSGLAMHNDQLGGGWQAGRVYVYVGRTGGGKSLFLMNCMRWARLFNKDMEPSRRGAKPCAVYLTLENDMIETVERLWDAFVPPSARGGTMFKDADPERVDEDLRRAGAWGGPPYLRFMYRRNKSVNTADVEAMLTTLVGDGYDPRMLVFDYVKRVKPVNSVGDLRQDLGEVVNEFSSLAKHWRIPVVTVMQMNITGISALEKAARSDDEKGGADPLLRLGTDAVGESRLIVENADFVFCIDNPVSPSDPGGRAFTAMRIKVRGKISPSSHRHIVYPYVEEDSFLIAEDADDEFPRGRTSTGDGLSGYDEYGTGNVANANHAPGWAGVAEEGKMPF